MKNDFDYDEEFNEWEMPCVGMSKSDKPIHKMDLPNYSVPCGDGGKIFGEGHGGSVYDWEVTCPVCRYIIGLDKKNPLG